MSNITNDETLEMLHENAIADDKAGLLDDEINYIAHVYNLHADDDRDEILQFIAENEFYKQFT
tara:strand:+ start:673 stop:861 length:189 start_codon:yes stop_codon:yes gene_type:complete